MGGFPELVLGSQTNRFRAAWVNSYLSTVTAVANVEQVAEVRRPALVANLVRQIAARSAKEIVVADLARELQVDEGTVRVYLDILATLYLIRLIPAWSTSQTTRAKKRAVGHLVDTALACAIVGATATQLAEPGSPWMGPLLESFVVAELAKQIGWSEIDVRLLQDRDRDQREIDVILEHGTGSWAWKSRPRRRPPPIMAAIWLHYGTESARDSISASFCTLAQSWKASATGCSRSPSHRCGVCRGFPVGVRRPIPLLSWRRCVPRPRCQMP